MTYPEVNSLEESLAMLKKHKSELNKEQYDRIVSVISGHAIEGQFANEKDIITLVKIEKGETTADREIQKLKQEWGVL